MTSPLYFSFFSIPSTVLECQRPPATVGYFSAFNSGNDKTTLPINAVFKNPFHNRRLVSINHQFALIIFVIAQESGGVDHKLSFCKLSTISPLLIVADTFAFPPAQKQKGRSASAHRPHYYWISALFRRIPQHLVLSSPARPPARWWCFWQSGRGLC